MSDIVITGISGRFPQSDNVEEFKEHLLNKVYLVGDPENRVKFKFARQAQDYGLMRNLDKFDYQAFRVPSFIAKCCDPQGRILAEHVYEAIYDAGVSPKSLMGTKTGVYVGCFNYDSLEHWMFNKDTGLGMTSIGNTAYALSNRISYLLGVHGPSFTVDTACSSSMYALNLAFKDMASGECDSAIVAGSNLILNPFITKDFSKYTRFSF
jgi:fatty acid synthase, animal type